MSVHKTDERNAKSVSARNWIENAHKSAKKRNEPQTLCIKKSKLKISYKCIMHINMWNSIAKKKLLSLQTSDASKCGEGEK